MLRDSLLLNDLEAHAFTRYGNPLCLYGNPAYPLRIHLQSPFKDVQLTQQMKEFNSLMSFVRDSVDWHFGLDFKQNLKIGLSSVGKMYVVAALMENALTCLYENLLSENL